MVRTFLRELARFSTSGPLVALLGFGIVMAIAPQGSLIGPGYESLFSKAPRALWCVACLLSSGCGYYGLYFSNRRAWLISHGTAVSLFFAMAIFFGVAQQYTGTSTYLALALNAWDRFSERYRAVTFTNASHGTKPKEPKKSRHC